MKTLIINGSPRKNGDTRFLVNKLKECLTGEIYELSPYNEKISPCVDCRFCWKNKGCAIKDPMEVIYADDYQNLVIASPVYMSALTPPVMNIASRLQIYYSAKRKLMDEIKLKNKNGGLILTAGGDGSPSHALAQASLIFRILKARYAEANAVLSLNTDRIPAKEDAKAAKAIEALALDLNGGIYEK